MKQTYTFRLDTTTHNLLKMKAKNDKKGMSDIMEEILITTLRETTEKVSKAISHREKQKTVLYLMNFREDVRKQLHSWIVKQNDKSPYVDSMLEWLELKKEEFTDICVNKKQKKEFDMWISNQIDFIKSRNWESVDCFTDYNKDKILFHLLKKKGLAGRELNLILSVINGNKSLKITKKIEETLGI